MTAQKMRMNTISSNIANINTVKTDEGGPYVRKDVIFQAMPDSRNFGEIISSTDPKADLQRVQVVEVRPDPRGPRLVYEPHSPYADEKGFVAYPNINLMEEMTNMIQATRAYEANVQSFQAHKDMALSALEIGR